MQKESFGIAVLPRLIFQLLRLALEENRGRLLSLAVIAVAAIWKLFDQDHATLFVILNLALVWTAVGVGKRCGVKAVLPLLLAALLLSLYDQNLVSLLDALKSPTSLWAMLGVGGGFFLLVVGLTAPLCQRGAGSIHQAPAPRSPQPTLSYDLLLTTVTRIPTFVKRFSSSPRSQRQPRSF